AVQGPALGRDANGRAPGGACEAGTAAGRADDPDDMTVIIFRRRLPPMDTATPSRKQQTHDRILDTAARVLRDSGFYGVGVGDIMKKAGLTHGGFYAHFASREALLAEALERAGQDSQLRLQKSIAAGEAKGISPFQSLVESYLSDRHLKAPEAGCPVAA